MNGLPVSHVTKLCVRACRGGRGVRVGPAQQSVREQVQRRRLCEGDVHRRLAQWALRRLRVSSRLMPLAVLRTE